MPPVLPSSDQMLAPSSIVMENEPCPAIISTPPPPAPSSTNLSSPPLLKQKPSWVTILSESAPSDRPNQVTSRRAKGIIHSSIPNEILQDHTPLWTKFIVGHFIGEVSPHIGKVHATVNRLWTSQDKKTRVDAQFIGPKTVLFRLEDERMRSRVLNRHFWHVADIPMIVQAWTPSTAGKAPDLSSIPLWVDFCKVPDSLFSKKGLLFLGNLVGKAQKLHPSTERCTRFDVARVLVEVNLNDELPTMLNLKGETEILIPIVFPWLPPRCSKCGIRGHKDNECVQPNAGSALPSSDELPSPASNGTLEKTNRGPENRDKVILAKECSVPETILIVSAANMEGESSALETNSMSLVANLEGEKSHGPKEQQQQEVENEHANEHEEAPLTTHNEIVEQSWTVVNKPKGSPGRTIMTRGKCLVTGGLSPSRYQSLEKDHINMDDIEDGEIHGTHQNDPSSEEEDAATYASQTSSLGEGYKDFPGSKKHVDSRKDINRVTRQAKKKSKKSSSRKA